MPRHPRLHAPDALVHVIVRFVNREHRIAGPAERAGLLERLPAALARADWRLHAYALMSTHFHLAATAGSAAAARWLKSLLVSFARYVNKLQGRFGPVVAERATTVVMPQRSMAALVAYLHNNPVRAGIADAAGHTDWTSHRAWTGEAVAPSWLAVEAGLSAAGFDSTMEGRAAFDRFVRERAGDPRDPVMSGSALRDLRTKVRMATALPLEVSSPDVEDAELQSGVLSRGAPSAEPRWNGDLRELVAAAAHHAGCAIDQVRSRSRGPAAVAARRIAVVAGVWFLRRQVNDLAAALAVSDSGASQMQWHGESVRTIAQRVATEVRAGEWA